MSVTALRARLHEQQLLQHVHQRREAAGGQTRPQRRAEVRLVSQQATQQQTRVRRVEALAQRGGLLVRRGPQRRERGVTPHEEVQGHGDQRDAVAAATAADFCTTHEHCSARRSPQERHEAAGAG